MKMATLLFCFLLPAVLLYANTSTKAYTYTDMADLACAKDCQALNYVTGLAATETTGCICIDPHPELKPFAKLPALTRKAIYAP
jgi:hypothetical protein